jgi:hypothetical protein
MEYSKHNGRHDEEFAGPDVSGLCEGEEFGKDCREEDIDTSLPQA